MDGSLSNRLRRNYGMKYFYPAVFTCNPKNHRCTAFFPDLPGCRVEGERIDIAEKAREALVRFLSAKEKEDSPIPSPSDERRLKEEYPEARICMILADTDNFSAYCARCVSCAREFTAAMKPAGSRHITGLDGLRALAIIGITLFHMFPQTIRGGYLGVSLFFVLSGCLLAYTCERTGVDHSFPLLSYYKKRIARIYPSLLIMMLVTIGAYSFFAPPVIAAIRPEALSVLLGFNNWWQISQSADYFTRLTSQSPFTHLWFLGIELEYYLIWPLLYCLYAGITFFYGRKAGIATFLAAGLLASCWMPLAYSEGSNITRLYYGTDTRIYALLLGAGLGFLLFHYPSGKHNPGYRTFSMILFILGLGATIYGYLYLSGDMPFVYEAGLFLYTLLFCLLIFLTADRHLPFGRLLDAPLLRWIGKYSYGIFLWQYPVIFLCQYMEWNRISPLMPVLEIAVIVVLSVWTELLVQGLKSLSHFSLRPKRTMVKILVVLILSIPGFTLMAYGARGIWTSSDVKVSDTDELKEQLAANEKMLETQEQHKPKTPVIDENNPNLRDAACIGDSVMLGSAMAIKDVLPNCYIDAKVSRYVGAGLDVARQMDSMGKLGHTVVIALGTNGPLDGQYEKQTKALLEYLGPDRLIFWVNVYCPATSWQDSNNRYIQKIAAEHPNVTVVDWYSTASKHPELLGGDRIHPNQQGMKVYAGLIHDAIAASR